MRCAAAFWMAMSVVLTGCGAPTADTAVDAAVVRAGAALWRGERPLSGHITGHANPLPSSVVRCINCHGDTARDSSSNTIPVLTVRHLHEAAARRGGPPSRYDAAAFCQVLRTGVDPAAVLLPRAMPRYEIGDADCAALWHYLTQPAGAPVALSR